MNRIELERYMSAALEEARLAGAENEVPVGAAVYKEGILLSKDHNRCLQNSDMTAHAELLCLQSAAKKNGGRLDGCSLFVTLEPCSMCTGAALNLRVDDIVFGAYDPVSGACASVCNLTEIGLSRINVIGGIQAEESEKLLSEFFSGKRCKKDGASV